MKNIAFIFLLLLISVSCSTVKSYKVEPDYNNPRYKYSELIGNNIVISKVNDNRVNNKSQIGFLDDIGFDKYQYNFSGSNAEFVKNSLNKIFGQNNAKITNQLNVEVSIDELSIKDESSIFGPNVIKSSMALRFTYTVDSKSRTIKTYCKDIFSTNDDGILSRIQYMIYDNIYTCAKQFVDSLKIGPNNILTINKPEIKSTDSLITDKKEIDFLLDYRKQYIFEYPFFAQIGENIIGRGGFGKIAYKNAFESELLYGFGIHFSYAAARNDHYKGSFWGTSIVSSNYLFLKKSYDGLFFTAQIELLIGSENINNNKTNFYIGPIFKEGLGVKIDAVSLKFGLTQHKVFGSDVLDSGFGYFAEIGIFTY